MFNEKVTLKDFFATFAHCTLLFLLLVLGVEAQAQRVIYPNGKNCAEPGETVTVEFDNKVDGLYFSEEKFDNKNETCTLGLFTKWDFGCTNRNISEKPWVNNVRKKNENSVEITVPSSLSEGTKSYSVYYGEQNVSVVKSVWLHIVFDFGTKTTKYSLKYNGPININVCTEDPVVRCDLDCFCPGTTIDFQIENCKGNHMFQLSYDDKNGHKKENQIVSPVALDKETGKGTIEWTVPQSVSSDLDIRFVVDNEWEKCTEMKLHMCTPKITNEPDCVKQYNKLEFSVDNACPGLTYEVWTSRKNPQDNERLFSLNGKTNYTLSYFVNGFDEVKNNKDTFYYLDFVLRKANDNKEVDAFRVVKCEITVNVQYNIQSKIDVPSGGCTVRPDYVINGNTYGNKWINVTQQGGSVLKCEYQYKEAGEDKFRDILSKTVFEVGKTYLLRTLVYVDDAFIQYFDSKEFTIKPYMAKVQADYGGTATVTSKYGHSNTEVALECGEAVTYQAEPSVDCYVFEKWQRYENNSWTDAGTSNPMMFFAESNVQYKAVFKQKQNYTVAAVPNNPTLGEVSLISNNNKFTSGSQTTYCNQPVTISAKALGCGKFKRWSDGNTEASRNFKVKEDIDLVAVFEEDTQKPVLICTSDNLTQTICKGDAIDPIFIESTTSKIKDVADLVDGLVVEHVKRSDDPNADKDYVHCSEYFKLERDYDNGGNMKVNFTKDQDYCKTLPNQKLKVVFYDDVNNKQVKLEVLLDCQTHKLDLSQCQDFYPGGLDADVTFYLEAEVEEGKTCGSLFNTDQGTFGGIEEIRPGDAIKISGTPTVGDGTYTFEVETDEKSCIDGTAKLDVNITVVGPAEIECNEAYAALSADGSVSFPLGSIATGEAESWKVSGNFTLTDGIISSKAALPFGVPVPITVAAVKCKQESLCHSTITLIKQVAPCEP